MSTLETASGQTQQSRLVPLPYASRRGDRSNGLEAVDPAGSGRALTGGGSAYLRGVLVTLDVFGIVVTWTIAGLLATRDTGSSAGRAATVAVFVIALVVVTLIALVAERLYLTRVCAARSVELTRLVYVAVCSGVMAVVAGAALGITVSDRLAFVTAVAMTCILAGLRMTYTVWLRSCRARGRFCRDLVIVGTGKEASDLCHLLAIQPELGYRVRGVVGDQSAWRPNGSGVPWVGNLSEAAAVTRGLRSGALVTVTSMPADELNGVVRELLAGGVHVYASTGMLRMGRQRLRAVPLSHETLFYVETGSHAPWQLVSKRVIDVGVATAMLILTAPVLAIAAILIKLEDRGSALFRQERVGYHGRTFQLLKLRTMVPDAAVRLDAVRGRNERTDGPLFKIANDPRITRVGKFLRATSIDELPQLLNVIRGDMSLVGPRPALPREVARFDAEHLARQRVRPGVTGLWQIEGRDNPSFSVYRRLDLFYVENWSLRLDATVLARTVSSVACSAFRALTRTTRMEAAEAQVQAVSDAGVLR